MISSTLFSANKFFYCKHGFLRNFRRIVGSSCLYPKSKMDSNALQAYSTTFLSSIFRDTNTIFSSSSLPLVNINQYTVVAPIINTIQIDPSFFGTPLPSLEDKSVRKKLKAKRRSPQTSSRNSPVKLESVKKSSPKKKSKQKDKISEKVGTSKAETTIQKQSVADRLSNIKLNRPITGTNLSTILTQKKNPLNNTTRNCHSSVDTYKEVERNRRLEESTPVTPPVVTNAASQIQTIQYSEDEDTRKTHKLFNVPKNVFHNIYQALTDELKKPFKVTPSYKLVTDKVNKSSLWHCTYHVKWPEEIKFAARDFTKQAASHKAALAGLNWLRLQQRINDKGSPLVYDQNQVKTLTKQTTPSVVLSRDALEIMDRIISEFQDKMFPLLKTEREVVEENNNDVEDRNDVSTIDNINLNAKKQVYLNWEKYLAKEKVVLPIASYKEDFINMLRNNRIVIVKGEPGCGKSTRVPQYVLEDWAKEDGLLGYTGRIAVTQPRRIAAISLAERVANERNEMVGHIVGYQVRLNTRFRTDTGRILYCTTGILLRHLQTDPNLTNFSHIILDEAHERDVNTDLLMNLIKRAMDNNPRLKLIIMSATIDTDMFSEYFDSAPVMEIPGFTYPVTQKFLDNCKIDVSKTLKMCEGNCPSVIHEDVAKVLEYIHKTKPEGAILCFLPGWEDIRKIQRMIPMKEDLAVYCLHSRLQDSDQWKIFSRPPPGVRKIILATNIAETSVTIDDVVYVVDSGMQKETRFDAEKGLSCIDCHWISKANATQRKGRAGRVQPGECYHMYTKSKFESFSEYSLPEIMRTSLTKIILDCKVFSNNMNALEFMGKLLTPPEQDATIAAVKELTDLELLDDKENLTSLGRILANFQLEPKLSKAMVNSVIFKCVTPIVDIVTLFSAETELFASGLIDKDGVKHVKQSFCSTSDHIAMMRVFEKWLEYKDEMDVMMLKKFCTEANLIPYKMETIEKLRKIHFDYLYNGLYDVLPVADDYSDNDELVKAVLFSGIGNVMQHRNWDIVKGKFKNNVNVFLTRHNHKATISMESVNSRRRKYPTDYLMYINEVQSNIRRSTLVRECSLIPQISVLLFSNKELTVEEIDEEFSNLHGSNDKVKLVLQDTNVKFICDRAQAQDIIKCKEALNAGYQYYIQNLTKYGEVDPQVNEVWDNIINLLNVLLLKYSVESRR